MKKIYAFIVLLAIAGVLYSQTSTIRGFVYSKKSGEPIIFTNVYLKGTSYGSTTDVNGFFTISKVPAGSYTLMITYLGYDSLVMPISLKAGEIRSEKLYMDEAMVNLNVVEISAERQTSLSETKISVVKVSPKEIKQIPTVGGQSDIAQYLQVLPGVVFTGDQGGQIYIRGGSPVQNKVLLDGMIVYNPFHSIGLFSVFETDIIRNADIYTGGFSAQYGGRISSVMDISTRDGNKKRFAGKVEANTFGANLLVEGPLKKLDTQDKKNQSATSIIISAKQSYLDKSSKYIYDYIDTAGIPFSYTDLYGKMTFDWSKGSKASIFGFNFNDQVNEYKSVERLKWSSAGGGGNIVLVPSAANSLISANFAYSSYDIEFKEQLLPLRTSSIDGFNAGINFTYFMGDDDLTYGIEFVGFNTDLVYYSTSNSLIQQKASNTETGAYLKYKKKFKSLILEPSIRTQYYVSLSKFYLEPRFASKLILTDYLRVKLAGGMYSQNLISTHSKKNVVDLFYGFLSGPENLPDEFDGEPINHSLQTAKDVIFGFEIDPFKSVTLNIESYYKFFDQLTNINSNKIFEDNAENAAIAEVYKSDYIIETGEAYGFDFVFKYDYRRYYLWAVYSLGYITRYDGIKTYYPFYDRRHNVNLVGSVVLGKDLNWELSARWNLGSGFPFAQTLGIYEKLDLSSVYADPILVNGEVKFIYDDENNGRLPYYHRLDVSLKRTFYIGDESSLEAVAGVTNAYDRKNIFYFDRVKFEQVDQLPFMPSLGLTFRF